MARHEQWKHLRAARPPRTRHPRRDEQARSASRDPGLGGKSRTKSCTPENGCGFVEITPGLYVSPRERLTLGALRGQVSRSREWAHPVGKVVFNSMEDGGCCCGVVGWTNAKAGAAAAARKQVVEAAEAPILACG